ncbi:TatD family hydrolase [Lacihabitans soyangensis]|uniref:Hydrolase TatD n=1 Tax=Lacihabitans soyangensis TaxID=869394 RepID=A0AAE3H0A3_9BACT|nr:TatD family hydrolase [Lacihabitans soyangensis]MCP9761696.1 hydrolase TatD [Lacihabitans soyangensis]
MFLDIHTHSLSSDANIKKVFNLDITVNTLGEDLKHFFGENESVSVGIHPWSVSEELFFEQIEILEFLAADSRVKAIGEIGLDKLKGPDLKLQEEVFLKQIRVAEAVKKPAIVHCVKSFNELIAIKKVVRPKVPMIIHGFNRKVDLAKELTQKGFFLSFGRDLLESDLVKEALKSIPLEQVFFETDDDKVLIVSQVYKTAADILKIDIEVLKDRIYQNYLELYL